MFSLFVTFSFMISKNAFNTAVNFSGIFILQTIIVYDKKINQILHAAMTGSHIKM